MSNRTMYNAWGDPLHIGRTGPNVTPEVTRANRYAVVRDGNIAAAADLSPDLTARLQALLSDLDGAIMNARMAIGAARTFSNGQKPAWQTAEAFANIAAVAITGNEEAANKALAGQRDVAASIVADASLAASPAQPVNTSDAQIADRKADILLRLQNSQTANIDAQAILSTALLSGDLLTAYVLLGPRCAMRCLPSLARRKSAIST
jgi:hypothetical protein